MINEPQKYGCKFARKLPNGETKPCCYVLGYGECQFLCEVGKSGGKYHFDIKNLHDCIDALITISIGEGIALPKENTTIGNVKINCDYLLKVVKETQLLITVRDLKTAIMKIAGKLNDSYDYPLNIIDDYIVAIKGISERQRISLTWKKYDIAEIMKNCQILADKIEIKCEIKAIDDIPLATKRIMEKLNEEYPQYPYCQIYWAYKDLKPQDVKQ